MTSFALFLVGILETKGVATKYFYDICIFFKVGGGGGGGCKFKAGICLKGTFFISFFRISTMRWPWIGHSLMILHVIIIYSIFNEDKHTFVPYTLWGGRGTHTHTSISLLALSPSLPPYFFPVPYLHTSLHYLNRLILCKHAKCKRNLDSNFMCYLVFLPGFHTLGSTGPIENPKEGHEGEKLVTIFRYS